ncbi:MAG: hypothetical protein C7B43_15450 [Sulfobacillus benefaciens]|uniref:Carbohydrate kinase PfkB domain-containing protein n=1 Tax=Sulfobacillus benefaciens TaxID=453960 RepID=A0A2T2WUQ5_9FIRM|nr:MAG: hypothetical protein C7B43_15450 [Sulfobacillus benefaciens]HBQ94091.1 hypothetical protein [Sulfobacillus sp.]
MRVLVLGSTVVDMPMMIDHDPEDGETIQMPRGQMYLGGKALNQALQLFNLGVDVRLITALGGDSLGQWALNELERTSLPVSLIHNKETFTAYAVPVAMPHKHFIFHVPGINSHVTISDLEELAINWEGVDIIVLQGEWPWSVSLWAAQQCSRAKGKVVLNPAPAPGLPHDLLRLTDTLISNQQELSTILGVPEVEWDQAMANFFLAYPNLSVCVVSLGYRGMRYFARNGRRHTFPAFPTEVVDPTGAGDSLLGAWIWSIGQGMSYDEAAVMGLRAGALAVKHLGAGTNLPTRKDLEQWL